MAARARRPAAPAASTAPAVERLDLLVLALDGLVAGSATGTAARRGARGLALGLAGTTLATGTALATRAIRAVARARRRRLVCGCRHALEGLGQRVHHRADRVDVTALEGLAERRDLVLDL